ncbi:hypothetical protein PC115_g5726 [Phytophthora cactorum]|uniref:Protein kinase domain-containing protein n=1 Tax=Phytophthora cactorum TaxID=29920 RepID=A0A8T1D5K5_9STRA|nr:hypothetical protein PC115_g5726 [Phytophthora cactorum]KAG3020700.1 hypothetical protein PC120_g9135 [Phytophthora cactorum]
MTGIMKKVTEFYKKDECSKYYKLGKTLGTGSFATVKSAISKADNSRWAVKCIDKASLTAEDEEALRVEVESIKSGVYDYPSPYWDCVSDSAKDLISRLLVVDPKKRFTAQQVLEHPWVADIHGVSGDALPHFTQEMKRYNARRRFRYGIMAAKTISALNSAQKRVSASDFDPPVAAIAAVGLEAVKTAAPTTTEGGTPAAPAPAPAGTQ